MIDPKALDYLAARAAWGKADAGGDTNPEREEMALAAAERDWEAAGFPVWATPSDADVDAVIATMPARPKRNGGPRVMRQPLDPFVPRTMAPTPDLGDITHYDDSGDEAALDRLVHTAAILFATGRHSTHEAAVETAGALIAEACVYQARVPTAAHVRLKQ
jgi:hypothetical protein